MLGEVADFTALSKEAARVGVKLIVDCVARISSKNYHRKYKDMMLLARNSEGLPVVCYGTDGRGMHYEDTAMLNYRVAKVWNLLIEDVLEFARKFQISGIHLDNAHAWPQIMELDHEEMYRTDSDGIAHYSAKEIFSGAVVKRNEDFAYWASSKKSTYPNPIFVKLCKEL